MENSNIVIRILEYDDWEDVCALYKTSALVELERSRIDKSSFKPMPEEESIERFFSINTALVACIDSRIVGFVAWRDQGEWSGSGYLSWLYVDPDFYNQGIGTRLAREAMPYLGTQAWTLTKPENKIAITLYKKLGMEVVDFIDSHGNIRLAVPTSKKYNPKVPNFGK